MDKIIRGFIAGAFDLLHPGHLFALRECRNNCDYLIVGLQVNPKLERKNKNRPVESVFERFIRLKACKSVDSIVPYETEKDLFNMLSTLDIQIRFLDEEYRGKQGQITGIDLIPIHYISRKHSWSSTKLRERLKK